jgi:hypothetical protein
MELTYHIPCNDDRSEVRACYAEPKAKSEFIPARRERAGDPSGSLRAKRSNLNQIEI